MPPETPPHRKLTPQERDRIRSRSSAAHRRVSAEPGLVDYGEGWQCPICRLHPLKTGITGWTSHFLSQHKDWHDKVTDRDERLRLFDREFPEHRKEARTKSRRTAAVPPPLPYRATATMPSSPMRRPLPPPIRRPAPAPDSGRYASAEPIDPVIPSAPMPPSEGAISLSVDALERQLAEVRARADEARARFEATEARLVAGIAALRGTT